MVKKNTKKISINALEKVIKDRPIEEIKHIVGEDENAIEIIVNPYISAPEYNQLIIDIVNGCIIDGEFYSALEDISIKSNVFETFTNIKTDNLSVVYDFIRHFPEEADGIVKDILTVFPDFYNDVYEAIGFEKEKLLHKSDLKPISDKIVELLDKFASKFDGTTPTDLQNFLQATMKIAGKNEGEIAKSILDLQKNNDLKILSNDIAKKANK